MTAAKQAQAVSKVRASPRTFLLAMLGIGALLVAIERLWLGHGSPLWLDETWTGMIAGQPTWAAFWREAWLDCNAPFYYLVMHGWQMIAGQSDWAMRAPSLIFAAAAGLLPVFWRPPGLSRLAALTWAGLIWFWWPGISISLDARAYSLLLLVSVAQTIAFASLLGRPGLRRALIWCFLASLALVTHYHAIWVAGLQGLIYLALHRGAAVKTWPAALLFLPSFAWTAIHLPRLAEYAAPDVAWYTPLRIQDVLSSTAYLVGPSTLSVMAALTAVLTGGWYVGRRLAPDGRDEAAPARHLWWVAASGLIAFTLVIGISLVRPLITERYLTSMVPPVLLGLILLASLGRRAHLTYAALVALFLASALTPWALEKRLERRALYGFQPHSEFLMQARPTQLIFAWDHPAAKILDEGSVAQLGGWFFKREGMEPVTVPLGFAPNEDPNRRLLAAADGERPAILWVYNKDRKSAARDYPPRITALAPDWRCLHAEDGPRGVIACAPQRLFD